jgi:hemerythrin-like domain-containing protein|tara:strand:- start:424 stop:1158 length:735 start_codon:yes stop_codon:yes gene_type:complete
VKNIIFNQIDKNKKMKIIDHETGKRLKELKTSDPVKANAEKDEFSIESELSPMDPPDAYSTLAQLKNEDVPFNDALNVFVEEHKELSKIINDFEKALSAFKEAQYVINDEINNSFKQFFDFFDNNLLPHNRKEEKILFPILNKALLANNEHGTGEEPITAVDLMEDDHIKFIQLGALTFNLLGLAPRYRDEQARMFTYDVAYNNAKELVELLKLHIFREDNTLFPLAQKFLSKEELKTIQSELH